MKGLRGRRRFNVSDAVLRRAGEQGPGSGGDEGPVTLAPSATARLATAGRTDFSAERLRRALRSMVFIERRTRERERDAAPLDPAVRVSSADLSSSPTRRRRTTESQRFHQREIPLCLYHLFFVPLAEKKKREEGSFFLFFFFFFPREREE